MSKKFKRYYNMNNHNNQDADRQPGINDVTADEAADVMDVTPDEDAIGENPETVDAEMDETEALKNKLDETEKQLEKEKKEYLFLMAEFDNFRKRTLKEKSEIIKNGAESAFKGLLPIVDDFERGLEAIKDSSDTATVKEGMELIYNKLVKYLSQNGVKPMESTGADFDPENHEAIAMVPVDDESKKGKVIDTVSKGYMINDKVLRHAKVAVGQ